MAGLRGNEVLNGRTEYPTTRPPVNLAGAATFRMPFWRWYLAALVVSQVLFAVLNILPALTIDPDRFPAGYYLATLPFGAAAFPVVLAPVMLLYVLVWTVRVAPAGLRASDMWGRFATVSWHSVTAVKPVPVPLLPYLRVYSSETPRVLWLPHFMWDYPRYAALVAEYAGGDHPIARELSRRLDDS